MGNPKKLVPGEDLPTPQMSVREVFADNASKVNLFD
jgi:hypothetical protein